MEGTSDETPLHLPKNISAQAFDMVCKFLYPSELGVLPLVLVEDLDVWEPLLEATAELQMPDIQNYVLENFEEDRPNIAPRAIQLLPLAVRLNSKWLELECFRSLAFRRRPISREELIALGPKMMAEATYVRERVRTAILSSGLPKAISLHASCSEPLSCFYFITQKVQANMTANPRYLSNFRSSDKDEEDIFDISTKDTEFTGSQLCNDCQPIVSELSELIRFSDELSQEVHKCVQDSKLLVADNYNLGLDV